MKTRAPFHTWFLYRCWAAGSAERRLCFFPTASATFNVRTRSRAWFRKTPRLLSYDAFTTHPSNTFNSFHMMAFSDSLSAMINSKHVSYRPRFPSGAGDHMSYFDCHHLALRPHSTVTGTCFEQCFSRVSP